MSTTTERVEWRLSAQDNASQVFRVTESSIERLRATYSRFAGMVVGGIGGGVVAQMAQQMMKAAMDAEQASARLDVVLEKTRMSANRTRAELEKMTDALTDSTTFDDESIRNAQATLLKFGVIHGEVFDRALKLAADYAAFTGTNIPEAAQTLGKALQSPSEGTMMLERNVGKLTWAQKEQIKVLMEQGKLWDAQAKILALVESKVGGTAEKMNSGLTGATRSVAKAWDELMESMGKTEIVGDNTNSFLGFVSASLTDMKRTVESGDWVSVLTNLLKTVGGMYGRAAGFSGQAVAAEPQRTGVSGIIRGGPLDPEVRARNQQEERRKIEEELRQEKLAELRKKAAEEAERQLKAFQSVEQQLVSETIKTQDLTRYEEVLKEIQRGRYGALTEAQKQRLLDLVAESTQNKAMAEWEKERLEAIKVGQEERAKTVTAEAETLKSHRDAADEYVRSLNDQMEMQQLEISLMGKSEIERATIIEQFRIELQVRERIRDLQKDGVVLTEKENEIRAAGARAKATAAEHVAMQKQMDEARRAAQVIEESLTDALLRGFESGKDFAENFRDSLKNMFKTLILRPIIQPIAMSAAGAITGMFGLPQVASANTGGGLLGTAGSLSNIYSAGSNFFNGGMTAGLMGSSAAYAAAVPGLSTFGAGSQAAMLAAQTGEFGAAGLAATASAGGASAGAASALSAVSAAAPYVAVALIAYSLMKGNGGRPTQALGDFHADFNSLGQMFNTGASFGGNTAGAQSVVQGLYNRFDALAKNLGATYSSAYFGYGANTGANSANPNFTLVSGMNGRQLFGVGEGLGSFTALNDANLAEASSKAILAALKSSQLPGYLAKFFDTLVPAEMTGAQADAALAFATSLKDIRDQLTNTPLELAQKHVAEFNAALGANVQTVDAWKTAFVAAIDAGITPEAVAGWQNLGTALEQVVQLTPAVEEAITNTAEVAKQRHEMELRIMELQGNTAGATAARRADELAAMDASLRPLQERINALEDEADAVQHAADIARSRRALEIQIMELSGDAAGALAARRQDELAAMDEALRPLQRVVYALEDLREAAQRVEEARATLKAAYDRESSALEQEIAKWANIADTLQKFRLSLGAEGLGGSQSYAQAKAALFSANADNIEQVTSTFLAEAMKNSVTREDYLRSVALAREQIENEELAARANASIASQQLDELKRSVAGLIDINNSVITVAAAIGQLQAAMAAQAAAEAAARSAASTAGVSLPGLGGGAGGTGGGYQLIGNTLYFPGGGSHSISNNANAAQMLISTYGLIPAGDGTYIRTRATGGYTPPGWTLLGEEGPELVNFDRPAMVYSASQTRGMLGDNAELVAAVRDLQRKVEELSAGVVAVALNTGEVARRTREWDNRGAPIRLSEAEDSIAVEVV